MCFTKVSPTFPIAKKTLDLYLFLSVANGIISQYILKYVKGIFTDSSITYVHKNNRGATLLADKLNGFIGYNCFFQQIMWGNK